MHVDVVGKDSSALQRGLRVDPALDQVLAGRLTRTQLSTYYAAKMRGSKKAKPLAESTVAHHHAMLKTAHNWALEEELLLVNPAMRVKNPPALRPKTRPVWSMAEISRTAITTSLRAPDHRRAGEGGRRPRRGDAGGAGGGAGAAGSGGDGTEQCRRVGEPPSLVSAWPEGQASKR